MLGLVLAGGLARRMQGRDKTLMQLDAGTTLLDSLLGRLRPQCARLAISANGDPTRFANSGLLVLPDEPGPSRGPLAGILAGLDHVATLQDVAWVITVPGDTPFIPADLVARLTAAARESGRPVARARSGERDHALVALWSRDLRRQLRESLMKQDRRKVTAFQTDIGVVDVDWPVGPHDPFFNVNTPGDLAQARDLHAAWRASRMSEAR